MTAELWTLGELADRVAAELSSRYDGQSDGRVTGVPDVRTIRYYTTLGLLDRPAAMRGRTAFYAARHLWQLVAIKRLQADGRTLAEVQAELAGASDATLRRVADLPGNAFWRRPPAPAVTPEPSPGPQLPADTGAPLAEPAALDDRDTADLGRAGLYQAVPLASGAVVLIPSRESLRDADIAAIRAAARTLDDAIARLRQAEHRRQAHSSDRRASAPVTPARLPKGSS